MTGDAGGETAGAPTAHTNERRDLRCAQRTDDAGEHHQNRGQLGNAADLAADADRDRCRHRFRRDLLGKTHPAPSALGLLAWIGALTRAARCTRSTPRITAAVTTIASIDEATSAIAMERHSARINSKCAMTPTPAGTNIIGRYSSRPLAARSRPSGSRPLPISAASNSAIPITGPGIGSCNQDWSKSPATSNSTMTVKPANIFPHTPLRTEYLVDMGA